MMTVKISKSNFQGGLKNVRSWGFRYDANSQAWTGKTPSCFYAGCDVASICRARGIEQVNGANDPATNWQGAASMDAENSIF